MLDLTYEAFFVSDYTGRRRFANEKTPIYFICILCSLHQGANPIIKKNVEQAQCDIATLHFCEWKKWQTFKLSNVCNPSREQPWNLSKKNSTDCLVLKIQQKTSLFDIKKLSFWSKNAETFLENDLKSWFDTNRVMVARFKVGLGQASPNFLSIFINFMKSKIVLFKVK